LIVLDKVNLFFGYLLWGSFLVLLVFGLLHGFGVL
jgi:hypothetical protein